MREEIFRFNKCATIKKRLFAFRPCRRVVKIVAPNSDRLHCFSHRSTWSWSDYKLFQGLKFVWSYFSKIWPHIGSNTSNIFWEPFFGNRQAHILFGCAILKFIWLGLYCTLFRSVFLIALWVQFLQSHSHM